MPTAVIGALRVNLSMDSAAFSKGAKDAESRLAAFGRAAAKMAAGVAVAVGAALTALTKQSFATIDAAAKLARRLDSTVASIQSLQYAADLAGVSSETLTAALDTMNKRLAEVERTGTGPAADALARLNLEASDLLGLAADDRLALLADRMQELGFTGAETSDALANLGIRAEELGNLLEGGGDQIRTARNELEQLGALVSDEAAADIEEANDSWTRLTTALGALGNKIAVAVAPGLNDLAAIVENAIGLDHEAAAALATHQAALAALGRTVEDAIGRSPQYIQSKISATRATLDETEAILANNEAALAGEQRIIAARALALETGDFSAVSEWWAAVGDTAAAQRNIDDLTAALALNQSQVLNTKRALAVLRGSLMDSVDNGATRPDPVAPTVSRPLFDEETQRQLDTLRESLMTAEELAELSYERRVAELRTFLEAQIIEQSEYDDGVRRAAAQLQEALTATTVDGTAERERIEQEARDRQLEAEQRAAQAFEEVMQQKAQAYQSAIGAVTSILGSLASIVGTQSEKALKISKAFALAEAGVNIATGITKALAGPFPWLNAAAVAAAGVAQIASIRRQQPGSASVAPVGGGAGAGGGSSGGSGGEPGGTQTIRIEGINAKATYTGDAVRELFEAINAGQRDGYRIKLITA